MILRKIEYAVVENPALPETLHLPDILELEFRYGRKLSQLNARKCSRGKVHRAKGAASLLKNKGQRNVIREKHFEDYNRSMVVMYCR